MPLFVDGTVRLGGCLDIRNPRARGIEIPIEKSESLCPQFVRRISAIVPSRRTEIVRSISHRRTKGESEKQENLFHINYLALS